MLTEFCNFASQLLKNKKLVIMKKVFTILAIATFVCFTACKSAPQQEEIVYEEVLVSKECEEEKVEDCPGIPTK